PLNWRFGLIALAIFVGSWAEARSILDDARQAFRNPGVRRLGLEVEYTGLPLHVAGEIAQRTLGGTQVFDKLNGLDRLTLKNSVLGDLVVKVETNIVRDGEETAPDQWVCEIVAPPLYFSQLFELQKFVTALRNAGAKATGE